MNNELLLDIKNLSIEFENLHLKDLNLQIKKGDLLVLTGESGTGKSTIFNAILGLLDFKSGSIKVSGIVHNQDNIKMIRSLISWYPQHFERVANGNVFDFMNELELNSLKKHEVAKEMNHFNLKEALLDSDFSELSGGEKQRIGVLITKLLNKDLVLLDEPTSALDKMNKEIVINYIFNSDKTNFVISHDEDIITRAENVILLEDNKLRNLK